MYCVTLFKFSEKTKMLKYEYVAKVQRNIITLGYFNEVISHCLAKTIDFFIFVKDQVMSMNKKTFQISNIICIYRVRHYYLLDVKNRF